MLADRGQDFACDPTTEGFGFGLAGHEDGFVEARLCNDVCLLRDTSIVEDLDTIDPILIEAAGYVAWVSDLKYGADVFEDEPRFTLFICHDADVVAEVVEDGDVVHQLFSFVELLLG